MARKPRAASAASTDTIVSSSAGAAPAGFQNSPEFQAALAAGIAQALPVLRDQILQNLGTARGAAPAVSGDHAFADALAMSIAQLTDQGVGRRHVAPEVLKSRAEARALMVQRIVEARASDQVPLYRLKHAVYLDEVLVDPVFIDSEKVQRPTEIGWPGVPNEAMQPANEAARGIFQAFTDSIGSVPANHQQPEREVKVIGGLVVQGRPIPRPGVNTDPGNGLSGDGGLTVPHLGRGGRYKETNVLGTLAAPARQTA
jgi:hypothetical protein